MPFDGLTAWSKKQEQDFNPTCDLWTQDHSLTGLDQDFRHDIYNYMSLFWIIWVSTQSWVLPASVGHTPAFVSLMGSTQSSPEHMAGNGWTQKYNRFVCRPIIPTQFFNLLLSDSLHLSWPQDTFKIVRKGWLLADLQGFIWVELWWGISSILLKWPHPCSSEGTFPGLTWYRDSLC